MKTELHYGKLKTIIRFVDFRSFQVKIYTQLQNSARYDLFLQRLIILPKGARCCPGHLSDDFFQLFV